MNTSITVRHDGKVLVRLEMGSYYRDFINSIPDNASDRDANFRNGVSCVVWGALYLEALVNDALIKVLEDGVSTIIPNVEMLWPFFESAKTETKFNFILDSLMIDGDKKKSFKKHLTSMFKLRNRLVHYKEPRKEVEPWRIRPKEDSVTSKIRAQISAANTVTPDIVDAVLSCTVGERRKDILEIGDWLSSAIFKYYEAKDKN